MSERNGFALAGCEAPAGMRVIWLLLAGRACSGCGQALRVAAT